MDPSKMKPRLDKFIATLSPTLKAGTCRTYRYYLRELEKWLALNNVALKKLRRKHMTQWFTQLCDRGLHPSTRLYTLIVVRVYLRWLYEEGEIGTPADDLIRPSDLPKLPSYLPRPLPPEADRELQKRLDASSDLLHQGLLLMRRTGVRIGELRSFEYNCTRTDHQGRQFLKVPLGKLDTERLVPLDDATAKLVESLQKRMRTPRRWLLETKHGKQIQYEKYRQALKEICEGLGIPDQMTTHRLRHSFATTLLSGGMSLMGIMKLLGHRDYRMTLRYAEITQETVVKEYFEALTQIEKRYHRKLNTTQGNDFNPEKAISDVIRWIHKNIPEDDGRKRAARLLIRRIERARKEISALRTPQVK